MKKLIVITVAIFISLLSFGQDEVYNYDNSLEVLIPTAPRFPIGVPTGRTIINGQYVYTYINGGWEILNSSNPVTKTWYVDPNYSGNITSNGRLNSPFTAIQQAFDSCSAGDLVYLFPGSYAAEHLHPIIDSIFLYGVGGRDQTFVALTASGGTGFDMDSEGMTIAGITFTMADGGFLIQLEGGEDGFKLLDCTVDVSGSPTIGLNIGASGCSNMRVDGTKFITDSGDGAIWMQKTVTFAVINNCEFIGSDSTSGYGIQTAGSNGGQYINNRISGYASGIFLHTVTTASTGTANEIIRNNTIWNCSKAIRLGHTSMTVNMDSIFVFFNTCYHNSFGIEIANDAQVLSGTFEITGNTIHDNTVNYRNDNTVPAYFQNFIGTNFVTAGKIDADYAEGSAAVNETRYYDHLVVSTVDPAASAEVNSGYFAYNKTAGSNGVYFINALEGVARSSYADEAGTFRGVYGRIYINADATSTMRTGIGGEFSARASYSGGTEAVAENGTAFVGARIWMAPYFTGGSLGNVNNFHGLWLYNEHTSNTVTNAIFVDDAGGTGGWTNGLNFNGATIGTSELIGSQGETWENVTTDGIWTSNGGATFSSIVTVDHILFTPQATEAYVEGVLYYDSDDKSLVYYNDEADVGLNVGQEMWKRVRNNSGGLITDGTPVYISGAVGQLPTIAPTDADNPSTALFAGLATHDIEDNSNGYITTFGIVRGLDTDGSPYGESWSDGDQIYISSTTGWLTNVEDSSTYIVCIGHLDYAHNTQGRIQVHPQSYWANIYRADSSYANWFGGGATNFTIGNAGYYVVFDSDSLYSKLAGFDSLHANFFKVGDDVLNVNGKIVGEASDGDNSYFEWNISDGVDLVGADFTIDATRHLQLPTHNDAATPTIGFGTGYNTGFYESSDGTIKVSHNGIETWLISGTAIGGKSSSMGRILFETPTSINPVFVPNASDDNTGIGHNGTDSLWLIAGGTGIVLIDPTGIEVTGTISATGQIFALGNLQSNLIQSISSNITIATRTNFNTYIDITAAVGQDGEIRLGDVGTAGEYISVDSIGNLHLQNGAIFNNTDADTVEYSEVQHKFIGGVNGFQANGTSSLWWNEFHMPAFNAASGGSGATQIVPTANTLGGYRLDVDTEIVYFQSELHDDWDGYTDIIFTVHWEVNEVAAADGTVDLKIICYYKGDTDVVNKTQTFEEAHTITGNKAQFTQHSTEFTITHDTGGQVIDENDVFSFLLNLETDTSECDDIIVNMVTFKYRTTKVNPETQ